MKIFYLTRKELIKKRRELEIRYNLANGICGYAFACYDEVYLPHKAYTRAKIHEITHSKYKHSEERVKGFGISLVIKQEVFAEVESYRLMDRKPSCLISRAAIHGVLENNKLPSTYITEIVLKEMRKYGIVVTKEEKNLLVIYAIKEYRKNYENWFMKITAKVLTLINPRNKLAYKILAVVINIDFFFDFIGIMLIYYKRRYWHFDLRQMKWQQ